MRLAPSTQELRLPLIMLVLSLAGSLAGAMRGAVLKGPDGWGLAFWAIPLLAPVGVVALLALDLSRRHEAAAWWGGIAAALVSAAYNFEALHPKYNEDANIGLGIHLLFGWLFPLGPAFVLGAALGWLAQRLRGTPPSPAALEDARPLSPLTPWLWPLLPPALVSLAVAAQPFVQLGQVGHLNGAGLPSLLLAVAVTSGGQLAVTLGPALVVLLTLRSRTAHDGDLKPRLAAFWGLCLGLAITMGLFGFGAGLLGRVQLEVYILLCALPPVLGYAAGRQVGRLKA